MSENRSTCHCLYLLYLLISLIYIGGTYLLGYTAENSPKPDSELAGDYFYWTISGSIIFGCVTFVYVLIYLLDRRSWSSMRQKTAKKKKLKIKNLDNKSDWKIHLKKFCPLCGRELPYHPFDKCMFCGWVKICPNCKTEIEYPLRECKFCGWILESLRKVREGIEEKSLKEQRSRRIPQHVKREVWRRDEGKCVECGSKENLEYDHIIPFSKGGSNTVRNIQLLCESCNRKKYNNIGG